MTDSYLAVSEIANDEFMIERMYVAVTQEQRLGTMDPGRNSSPISWVDANRYVWAASPGWAEAWKYAQETHKNDPDYEPGRDESVITDAMILAAVQALGSPAPGVGKAVAAAKKTPTPITPPTAK